MNKTAFLFPGQGSQSPGMLAELASQSSVVGQTFDEASNELGYDLWELVQSDPEKKLDETEFTQPAMLAAGVSCWRVWKSLGGSDPHFMAGHSLGEYSALVASGALDFRHAVKLVSERARRMQASTPSGSGAMAAILGLDEEPLAQVCMAAAQGQVVACANFNAPGQIVIAGDRAAVERACVLASEAGARRAVLLAVSVPSHCALMRDAAQEFAASLASAPVAHPAIPVLHNVDALARESAAEIREALQAQLWQPVRWSDTVTTLASQGVSRFAECGPGKVLAGLNRRIVRDAEIVVLTDVPSMQETMERWS